MARRGGGSRGRSAIRRRGLHADPDIRGARSAWDGGTVIDNPWMAYFTDIHQIRRINRFNLVDVYAMGGSRPGAFAPLHVAAPAEQTDWARRFLSSSGGLDRRWIAVQAGASDVMKAWRPQHFGMTLARFSKQWDGGILFIGSSSEQDTIAHVIRTYQEAGGRSAIKNAAGHTTLAQLVALLADCRLLLTNDTGPMHLAVGVQTPVIDLSVGHVDFQETGPHGPGHWVMQPDLECAPCGFEQVCSHHTCKERLPIDAVAAVMQHVAGLGPLPMAVPGYRVYQSSIDADQLGSFELVSGHEDAAVAWYARRFLCKPFRHCSGHKRRSGRRSLRPARRRGPQNPSPQRRFASCIRTICRGWREWRRITRRRISAGAARRHSWRRNSYPRRRRLL
ncbi:MAG: glycosyltransferase family 9 protein [Nitrospirae bacterium]|nr:glycosyltransferase family 9 protein [Nitrospirota bacterium]